jgi:hypothetical protein
MRNEAVGRTVWRRAARAWAAMVGEAAGRATRAVVSSVVSHLPTSSATHQARRDKGDRKGMGVGGSSDDSQAAGCCCLLPRPRAAERDKRLGSQLASTCHALPTCTIVRRSSGSSPSIKVSPLLSLSSRQALSRSRLPPSRPAPDGPPACRPPTTDSALPTDLPREVSPAPSSDVDTRG